MSELRYAVSGRVKFLGDTSRSCSGELSNETQDLTSDILVALGCDKTIFGRNPVCLFNHDVNQPIGRWNGVAIQDKRVVGTMTIPPPGASARTHEICNLVNDGVISGISVGFIGNKFEPLSGGGLKFTKWTLLDASLVAIPANPSALITQRRLSRSASRAQRMARAVEQALVAQLLSAGLSVADAEFYVCRHAPRGNCARPASSPCGLRNSRECKIHRGR